MKSRMLLRLEKTNNKEIMEKYGCKRYAIGDQVMEEFQPLVPGRLDDHQPVDFFDESGRKLFTLYPAIGKQSLNLEKSFIRHCLGNFYSQLSDNKEKRCENGNEKLSDQSGITAFL